MILVTRSCVSYPVKLLPLQTVLPKFHCRHMITWGTYGHRFFGFEQNFQMPFYCCIKHHLLGWVLGNFEGVKDIAVRLQESVPITLSEIDCLGLRYSDFVMMGVVIYVVAFALSIIIPVSIKVTITYH